MATQPSHRNLKEARNEALFADYLGAGYSRKEIAIKYDLSTKGLESLLARHDVTLPSEERSRRRIGRKLKPKQPVIAKRGRKAAWPDCPPHLKHEYMRLRRKGIPAADARALLDTQPKPPTTDDLFVALLDRERSLSIKRAKREGALDSPALRHPAIVDQAWDRETEQAWLANGELRL